MFAGAQTTSWFLFAVFGHVVSPFSTPVADGYLCGKYGIGQGPPDLQCPFKDRRGGDQHCWGFAVGFLDGYVLFKGWVDSSGDGGLYRFHGFFGGDKVFKRNLSSCKKCVAANGQAGCTFDP